MGKWNLERAGVSRSVAMKLTGHRTESVFRRYAIVSEADLAVGVGRLAGLHGEFPHTSRTIGPDCVGGRPGGVAKSLGRMVELNGIEPSTS